MDSKYYRRSHNNLYISTDLLHKESVYVVLLLGFHYSVEVTGGGGVGTRGGVGERYKE